MPAKSKHLRLTTFLLLAVGLVLACGITTSPQTAQNVDPTLLALELQATAQNLQLTAVALQNPTQGAAAPTLQAQIPPTETQPVYTATATPRIVFPQGVIEITDGQKLSSYPRKSPDALYGFRGTQGDTITLLLESSSAHPNDPKCKGMTASTTFNLRTPTTHLPAVFENPRISSLRDFAITVSGAYFVDVSCTGSGCNGNCTQADLSLTKN